MSASIITRFPTTTALTRGVKDEFPPRYNPVPSSFRTFIQIFNADRKGKNNFLSLNVIHEETTQVNSKECALRMLPLSDLQAEQFMSNPTGLPPITHMPNILLWGRPIGTTFFTTVLLPPQTPRKSLQILQDATRASAAQLGV